MHLSRRFFIGAVGAGVASAALGVPAVLAQTPAQRLSLQAFSADPKRVAALRLGVEVMKARPPTDPTSWFWQGAVHWYRESWLTEQAVLHPGVIDIAQDGRFWRQCPHGGPFYDFALWHRAYLWHFERILAAAAEEAGGAPDLRVPYWAYDDPSQRLFPAIFAEGLPEPGEDPQGPVALARNPLFDARRDAGLMAGLYPVSPAAVDMSGADQELEFFGSTSPAFGGSALQAGRFEITPHGSMHSAIGGAGGLMSSVPTAAFDPIFWVHHCNIDRLWRRWECRTDVSWGTFPTDWLDASPWYFQDADGTVHNHPRRWYLDDANLGVAFDTADPTCTPLSAKLPKPVAEPVLVGSETLSPEKLQPFLLALSEGGIRMETGWLDERLALSAEAPVEATVPLAAPAFEMGPTPGGRVLMSEGSADLLGALFGRTVLVLEDISVPETPSVRYDIHVNPGPEPSLGDPSFVGSLNLFMLAMGQDELGAEESGHEGHGAGTLVGGGRQEFDISAQVALGQNELRVAVVPVSLYGPVEEGAVPLRSGEVTIGRMVIERAP